VSTGGNPQQKSFKKLQQSGMQTTAEAHNAYLNNEEDYKKTQTRVGVEKILKS
jgi:hypothetical protein